MYHAIYMSIHSLPCWAFKSAACLSFWFVKVLFLSNDEDVMVYRISLHVVSCFQDFFCLCLHLVQWSKSEHFVPEVGEFVMCDVREKEYTIPDLNKVVRHGLSFLTFFLHPPSHPSLSSLPSFLHAFFPPFFLLSLLHSLSLLPSLPPSFPCS